MTKKSLLWLFYLPPGGGLCVFIWYRIQQIIIKKQSLMQISRVHLCGFPCTVLQQLCPALISAVKLQPVRCTPSVPFFAKCSDV